MEINYFFRDICSSKLQIHHIKRLEMNIVGTICKLEMIFPSSFFNSMEHHPYIYRMRQKLEDQSSIYGCIYLRC
jgi:hypothetical protein